MSKKAIIWSVIIIIILIIGGAYFFLQNNKTANPNNTNATSTASLNNASPQNNMSFDIQGMKVDVLQQGTGDAAKTGDTVTVNYTGTLTDGTKFDSSLNPGRTPFQFTLGQNKVIQGWELGVVGMKVGEKRKLTIPPELGYGSQTVGPIPANSTLVFEVDLLGINK